MQIDRIHPQSDPAGFADWFAIWHLTDEERFPGEVSWDEQDVLAMAEPRVAGEHHLLLARTDAGHPVGAALVFFPLSDNRHSIGLDVRVHPDHRRLGVGRALVDAAASRAVADGRSTMNCVFDVPIASSESDPSGPFARAVGFVATHSGNRRQLRLPVEASRLEDLRRDVSEAPQAAAYRTLAFIGMWPEEFIEDECALERAMSTDQPQGDDQAEEEVWDAARVREMNDQLVAGGMVSLSTAAQHMASGRLVAYTRMVFSPRRPTEAWQWATIVLKEHRGHRLGLAVKLANLELLATELPTAQRVLTSNASVNAPMISVNDMMGFEVDAVGAFWQKTLATP
jgi:GNAT superfamily N-acetyltransferase